MKVYITKDNMFNPLESKAKVRQLEGMQMSDIIWMLLEKDCHSITITKADIFELLTEETHDKNRRLQ